MQTLCLITVKNLHVLFDFWCGECLFGILTTCEVKIVGNDEFFLSVGGRMAVAVVGEVRLLAAFRAMHVEERDLMVDLAEKTAARSLAARPMLRLVVCDPGPAGAVPFGSTARKIKNHLSST